MRKYIILSLVLALLSGCAHTQTTATTTPQAVAAATTTPAAGQAPDPDKATPENTVPLKDMDSFRVQDAEKAPQVVDQELETIPTEVNPLVDQWIGYFQGRGRRYMEKYLARSTRYEKIMKTVLRENGLPEDLFYIALIESGFNTQARSHAAAVGYWQFIRGTGKRYGLDINTLVDERKDPVLATQAAAEYFKGLYSVFGSWYLAMASYNVGENRVKREVMNHYTRDFWELARKKRFPKETIHYIPKFIAAKLIAKDPAKYGFDGIDFMTPIEFDHITVDKPVNLRVMAEKMNLNYEDFKDLNPKFKGEIAPMRADNKLELRIPPGTSEQALTAANDSAVEKVEYIADNDDTQMYRIRRGDSLHSIAHKFRTTIAYLRDLNDIPKGKRLRVGMKLYVPDRSPISAKRQLVAKRSRGSSSPSATPPAAIAAATPDSKTPVSSDVAAAVAAATATPAGAILAPSPGRFYIVQSGDTLSSIAKRYAVSVGQLKKANGIRRGRLLRVGIRLQIPGTENSSNDTESGKRKLANVARHLALSQTTASKPRYHIVKKGDTLEHIADRYKVSLENIKTTNKIKNPSKVLIGARLLIPEAAAVE